MKERRVLNPEPMHASEGEAAAPADATIPAPLTAVLTQHVLSDGERVLLALKPSLWMIPISGIRFIGLVVLGMVAASAFWEKIPHGESMLYIDVGIFLITGRVMWSVLQWMGRLYVLTDLRIVRLQGVFRIEIYACPLRKVARARLLQGLRDRLLRIGSIEIIPQDEQMEVGEWQLVGRAKLVHRRVLMAIARAKQGGCGE